MPVGPANARDLHPHYELLEKCGQGGMGVVYKARDKRLDRIVALKFVLDGRTGSEENLKRFHREAASIAALNHPNIATLYEAGEWSGEPFLAMEYLSGGTLSARREPRGAGYEDLCRYATELGGALHFAHSRGILHRDVKPGNGMFSEHGVLKLVDFGLAKPRIAEDLTHTGTSVGTIGYMAPELLRGEEATVRTDLYALGATLYELAAGHPMFVASNVGSLVDRVLRSQPVPLGELRPDLPASLTGAISRAVLPAPENRFASVNEFLECLRIPSGVSSATRSLTHVNRPSEKPGRRKLFLAGGAALAILLATIAGIYLRIPPAPAPDQVLVVLPFENLGGDPANQALCDGLQETVTGLLSIAAGSRNLLVVPSSEVRRGQVQTIAEARKQFKADLALTGSAQKTPGLLLLTLNLDDAVRIRQKDSITISTTPSETAELQDKLATGLGSLFGYGSLTPAGAGAQGRETTNSAAYSLYLEGAGAVEKREADAAIGFLQKALQADPAFATARAKLAEAYLWKNTFTKDPKWLELADEEVNRAARSGPGHETLLAQAMIKKATGDLESAIQLFRQLVKNEPGDIEAYELLSQTLVSANRPVEAEATLQQAIRLRPGYWPLHNDLGIFYMNRQDYVRSEREFSAAAALAPDSSTIYSNLGVLYFATNRWSDAAASFARSLEIKPNALAHANLGTAYFYEGKYEEAAKHALASTQMQPANPLNWGNLGDARWQLPNQRAAALEAFEHAALLSGEQLSLNPNNLRLRKSYALYLAKLGRAKEAIAQIERAILGAPGDMNVQFYAARVFAVVGETSRARTALDKCLALGYSRDEIEREPDLIAIRHR